MAGRTAIIVGATGGIGHALANILEARADFEAVYRIGRGSNPAIALLDEASIADAARYFAANAVVPDLILVATGILHQGDRGPEKSLRDLDPEWMMLNYQLNAIGPALVAKHFLPLMPKDKQTCFAALSARVGSISDNRLGGWHSYRASKAALNMLIRNLSIEWQRKNPRSVIVGLHPGTVETPLSAPFRGNPAHERFTPELAAEQLIAVLDGLKPKQSGQLFGYDGHVIVP
jgi:NAD(P)-dependent dehydrogenase (short-subunit alcohol dehydrogenase family)